MDRKRKLYAGHLTISLLRYYNRKDIVIRSIYGVLVLLYMHLSMEDRLFNQKMLNKHIKR